MLVLEVLQVENLNIAKNLYNINLVGKTKKPFYTKAYMKGL